MPFEAGNNRERRGIHCCQTYKNLGYPTSSEGERNPNDQRLRKRPSV
jgi:hypothetical protein